MQDGLYRVPTKRAQYSVLAHNKTLLSEQLFLSKLNELTAVLANCSDCGRSFLQTKHVLSQTVLIDSRCVLLSSYAICF